MLVSVIMSSYLTPEQYLRNSIESILNQTYKDFEFIIVDDSPNNVDSKIIESYIDSRIVLLKNTENKGLPYSLNRGLMHAKGKYIIRMDSDDISLPNRIEMQVSYMEKNKDVDISSGYAHAFGHMNKDLCYPIANKNLFFELLIKNCIIHPAVIIKKEFLDKNHLLYDEKFRYSQDYELWSRAMFKGKIVIIPEFLINYRIHEKQISTEHLGKQKRYVYDIYKNIYRELNILLSDDDSENLYALSNARCVENPGKLILLYKKLKRVKITEREALKNYKKRLRYYLAFNILGNFVRKKYKFNKTVVKVLFNPIIMINFLCGYAMLKRKKK